MKIEDLKINQEIILFDGTEGRIICLVDETYKDWSDFQNDFCYITKSGEVREAVVEEIKETVRLISREEIFKK